MKVKNKQDESKNFSHYKRLVYIAIAIMALLIFTGFFLNYHPNQASQPKAAIIDQLSSSELTETSRFPNQTFIETAKEMLYRRFPEVDYYSDNATVDQYESLSSSSYELIVWRAHSALNLEKEYIAISTSEKYDSTKYNQYSADQLTLCNITYDDPELYFAITPTFVEECMSGRFEDTVIIFMSCNGLKQRYTKTAEAFVEKGVRAWISWDEWIYASDNDQAITLLLDYLINKNNTISEAVHKIDSYSSLLYGLPSTLRYYPRQAADYYIPDYNSDNIGNNAGLAVIGIFLRTKWRSRDTS